MMLFCTANFGLAAEHIGMRSRIGLAAFYVAQGKHLWEE